MAGNAVGIDLGTSTSIISVLVNGRPKSIPDPASKSPIVPSVVARNRKGELLVGHEALNWVDRPGLGVREVKRQMGGGTSIRIGEDEFRPEEISAMILRELKRNAEAALDSPVEQVVITVPANFADPARKATLAAADIAGLEVIRLINEPTAAALAYGIDRLDAEELLLVYDFGGGTLDVTILEMVEGVIDVRVSDGDRHLGGKDLDDALTGLVVSKWQSAHPAAGQLTESDRARLKARVEQAKKDLSSVETTEVFEPNFMVVRGEPLDLDVEVTRAEFEAAIQPLLERSDQCVRRALKAAGVSAAEISRAILVGGTTYVPAVKRRLEELLGKQVVGGGVDPDLAVSQGAAIMAGIVQGEIDESKSVAVSDVSRFGLGISVLKHIGNQWMIVYEPLIAPNQKIPHSIKREYSLVHPDQREVEIIMYQDKTGKAQLPEEAEPTGLRAAITDIPPALYGSPHPLEVTFSYNVDETIELRAEIPGLNKRCEIRYDLSAERMSDEARHTARSRLEKIFGQSELYARYAPTIQRAEAALTKVAGKRVADQLRDVLTRLKAALQQDDAEACKEAEEELLDLLFRIELEG